MNKFNVWRFNPDKRNVTGGWEYFVTIKTYSEHRAIQQVAKEYNIPYYALKAYPHIDSMAEAA